MKTILSTPESALELNVINPIVLGRNGENLPVDDFNFKPFIEEKKVQKGNSWTDIKANVVEFLKTLPSACAYACHH
ncbi:hypothetical protein HN014_22280 (plasmid) [Aquimarina sp. TRL1]|uniref:hypothetical protein n=1 Tax=Aquimarina sp. (strain TRL1) TaxID=2736252 RepID=UPI001589F31E|nr:hypothetical protein [Aquimarina sp. TRL1]QKX07730.1 hypothetical protein HN014_22280 [Aquimarina sp. TRL1]